MAAPKKTLQEFNSELQLLNEKMSFVNRMNESMSRCSEALEFRRIYGPIVTFVIEGKEIKAKKDVLSLHSSYFQTLFTKQFAEKSMSEIPLYSVKYEHFKEMLMLLDRPSVSYIEDDFVEPLLKLGDMYLIKAITDRVEDYLIRCDDYQFPVQKLLLLADRYRLIRLYTKCFGWAWRNWSAFISHEQDGTTEFDLHLQYWHQFMGTEEFGMISESTKAAFLKAVTDRYTQSNGVGDTTMVACTSVIDDTRNGVIISGCFPSLFGICHDNEDGMQEDASDQADAVKYHILDQFYGAKKFDACTFEIGGLYWSLEAMLETATDHLSFCLVLNNDVPFGYDFSVEGIVEFELKYFDDPEKTIINKQYQFSLGNESRKGWTKCIVKVEDWKNWDSEFPEFHVMTKIHLTKLTGVVRPIPKFDFTAPSSDSLTNVMLIVEGKEIHVNKQYLSCISPVFHEMFADKYSHVTSNQHAYVGTNFENCIQSLIEQHPHLQKIFHTDQLEPTNKIELEGVNYEDCIDFLNWIYPSAIHNFEERKFDRLLKLAKRFKISSIKEEIEKYLESSNPLAHVPQKIVFRFTHDLFISYFDDHLDGLLQWLKASGGDDENPNYCYTELLQIIEDSTEYKEMSAENKGRMFEWLYKKQNGILTKEE